MFTCYKEQIQFYDGKYVCEASDINLRTGVWPEFIVILEGKNEGILFQKMHPDFNGEELAGWNYQSKQGVELLVIND